MKINSSYEAWLKIWPGLVWSYDISTIVGHLIPNPAIFTYIKYTICKHIL